MHPPSPPLAVTCVAHCVCVDRPDVASSFDAGQCTRLARDCRGPFPFASGWLISLSAVLARKVAHSQAADNDVRRMLKHLQRNWTVLEDIWLGYMLHNRARDGASFGDRVTWVGTEHGDVFNGVNAGRVFASPSRAFPTTYVYHHPALAEAHSHAMASHVPPRPELQCTRGASSSGLAAGEGKPMVPWVRQLARGFESYARGRAREAEQARLLPEPIYCMMVDLT